jgi:hypothetical protein
MTDKETMPEKIWLLLHEGDEGSTVWCDHIPNDEMETIHYFRHDTAISKKALIELLEGKRITDTRGCDWDIVEQSEGYNALIDELIKEIE